MAIAYGINELIAELTAEALVVDDRARDVVAKTVTDGAVLAADFARFDTGATRNSIIASPMIERVPEGGWRGEWGSTTHYDPYQEFGTSTIEPNWHHRRAFERVAPGFQAGLRDIAGLT